MNEKGAFLSLGHATIGRCVAFLFEAEVDCASKLRQSQIKLKLEYCLRCRSGRAAVEFLVTMIGLWNVEPTTSFEDYEMNSLAPFPAVLHALPTSDRCRSRRKQEEDGSAYAYAHCCKHQLNLSIVHGFVLHDIIFHLSTFKRWRTSLLIGRPNVAWLGLK